MDTATESRIVPQALDGLRIEELSWLPFLLQTADALFPTGAYAHSLGFEEMVRLGVVRDEGTLRDFLLQQVAPAQERLELPYLRFAFHAEGVEELCSIDREIDAWKLARETRLASTQLGVRRLKALRTISDAAAFADFESAIQDGRASGHHLVVSALQARVEGVPVAAALAAYYYQSLAAICAAAVRKDASARSAPPAPERRAWWPALFPCSRKMPAALIRCSKSPACATSAPMSVCLSRSSEIGDSPFVERGRLDEFRFRVWMVNQSHPIARRAARMT
jgi:urease accessory protein